MKVIPPVTILPTMLTSNVAEDDAPVWVAGTYALGDKVIKNHHVFESLSATNTATPGAETVTPLKWLDKGATNRWAMFDKSAMQIVEDTTTQRRVYLIGTKTSNLNSIEFTIVPSEVISAVTLFGLAGYRVTVTMTDPVDGVVYSKVVSLVDPTAGDMWEWLFKPIGRIDNLSLTDLPAYGTASIKVLIEASVGTNAECQMATIGQILNLGVSCFGTTIGITDFSSKKVDDFGVESVIERGYRDRVQYDVRLETENVYYVKKELAKLRSKGAVYIGTESRQETIVFGRYKELQLVLDSWSISQMALDVGSLL